MRTLVLAVLGVLMLSTSALALDVPRSENAKPAAQAETGLTTAESHNTNADAHVPA